MDAQTLHSRSLHLLLLALQSQDLRRAPLVPGFHQAHPLLDLLLDPEACQYNKPRSMPVQQTKKHASTTNQEACQYNKPRSMPVQQTKKHAKIQLQRAWIAIVVGLTGSPVAPSAPVCPAGPVLPFIPSIPTFPGRPLEPGVPYNICSMWRMVINSIIITIIASRGNSLSVHRKM